MKKEKNYSVSANQNSLMNFKRNKKYEWIEDFLFGTGLATSFILFISLTHQ